MTDDRYTQIQLGAILMAHLAAGESYTLREIAAECQCTEARAADVRDQLVGCGVAWWSGSELKAMRWCKMKK